MERNNMPNIEDTCTALYMKPVQNNMHCASTSGFDNMSAPTSEPWRSQNWTKRSKSGICSTLAQQRTCTHMNTHTHTHIHIHKHTHTHTHTYIYINTHIHFTYTHTHTRARTLTSFTRMHVHTCARTRTYIRRHTPCDHILTRYRWSILFVLFAMNVTNI